MTPDAGSGLLSFATRRGEIRERADFNYSRVSMQVAARFAKPLFPLVPISTLAIKLQYGTSSLASEEPLGLPILRMNNLQAEGWDLNDLKYIQLPASEAEAYRLVPGDILFNRTNGSRDLVGKCETFREVGHWVFASYLIRMRIDEDQAYPEFVSAFLNTAAGRLAIAQVSRQILMSNINLEEIRALRVPLPGKVVQRELLDQLEGQRRNRSDKLATADALLSSIDDYLIDRLGISRPPSDGTPRLVYAAKSGEVRATGRLNIEYYHPERERAIQAIRGCNSGTAELREVANFIREPSSIAEPTDYIGLAHVQRDTGELVTTADEEVGGAVSRFHEGDVLFARLRPYLNKVYRAERPGVCSPEFHVIRVKSDADRGQAVLPDYLAAVLRSSLVVAQTRHMMTGNTHPRLANEDVTSLVVPVPSREDQLAVADEVVRRRRDARRLRGEADLEWAEARSEFEQRLLG